MIDDALGRVLGEHPHNCSTFYVMPSDDEEFTLQFALGRGTRTVWNVAGDPPRGPPADYRVRDSGPKYIELESDAETVEAARRELQDLSAHMAGGSARVEYSRTFRMYRGLRGIRNVMSMLFDAAGRVKAGVVG